MTAACLASLSSLTGISARADESSSAMSQDSHVTSFGVDISSTSYLLKAKSCTIGFEVAACGLTDDFLIATSPWLWDFYNTVNVVARFRVGPVSAQQRQAIQAGYFKSYNSDPNVTLYHSHYEMELEWVSFVRTYFVTPDYAAHFNLQGMYYRNDKWPFSLRRPWVDRGPFQFNATVLNEVHLVRGFYLNAEFGLLGFTQSNPEILFGVSFEYRLASWLFRGGFSQTGTFDGYAKPLSRVDYQAILLTNANGYSGTLDPEMQKYDFAIHPEFTLQYYF
jgi:hypothetical protein